MASRYSEYDFVEQPPEEYFCPVSFAVLLEPYQTQCCGNHLSQEAYQRLRGQPCPLCKEENFTAMKDKFHRRKVLSLKVKCPYKAEGCEWEETLGSLEQHLNINNSAQFCARQCQYVDVDCPYSCGERVKRHALELHAKNCMPSILVQEVPKLKVTVQQQSEQIKQDRHQIKQQADQIKQDRHQIKQQADQIKQQGDQIKQQGDQIKKQGDLIKQQGDLLKKQGGQIEQQQYVVKQSKDQIKVLLKYNKLVVPPVNIVMDEFRKRKMKNDNWYSPPFYSHIGGYKMCLNVNPNGCGRGEGTHVSVFVCLMRGEFDDDLKWPFRGDVTIQLKKKNPPYHEDIILLDGDEGDDDVVCKPTKEKERNSSMGYEQFIFNRALYSDNYIGNDKLLFCVSDITVQRK